MAASSLRTLIRVPGLLYSLSSSSSSSLSTTSPPLPNSAVGVIGRVCTQSCATLANRHNCQVERKGGGCQSTALRRGCRPVDNSRRFSPMQMSVRSFVQAKTAHAFGDLGRDRLGFLLTPFTFFFFFFFFSGR
ncbi:hypothetical protein FN846DRAFT_574072 [Sphaerosporella brunnea]|uniref:Uncharacterized protein n=1 Tax=Sphaerosporella brunnea TaxID=1250544 RepID=A0A5J5F2F2_9PEZI|nr:hypothetical protein FN846DRAFT_574072 [Sphaerosporella brunnea]